MANAPLPPTGAIEAQTQPETLENYLSLTDPLAERTGGNRALSRTRWRLSGDDDRFCGCISEGDTLEEAMANIQVAKIAWMETAWEYGDQISLLSQF